MTEPQRVQLPRTVVWGDAIVVAGSLWVLFVVYGDPLLGPIGSDPARKEIRDSAFVPVGCWCLSWSIMAWWWPGFRGRSMWTVGCLSLVLHIAIAFHLGHGWSHRAAWEHTRAVGGYGDGIFVNYAFALVWLADVIWARVAFDSYRARPRWLHGSIHGFLAFIVFNAAVVFADWGFRIVFAWLFVGPLVVLPLAARYARRRAGAADVGP